MWEFCYIDWGISYIARGIRYILWQIGYSGCLDLIFQGNVLEAGASLSKRKNDLCRSGNGKEKGKSNDRAGFCGLPHLKNVKFRDMVYRVSLDILYIYWGVFVVSRKRSTIVERFRVGSISRTRVLQ